MKSKQFMEELRSKSVTELNEDLVAAKKELFNLKFQNATNQLDNTSRIKEVKKNIARIQTVSHPRTNSFDRSPMERRTRSWREILERLV